MYLDTSFISYRMFQDFTWSATNLMAIIILMVTKLKRKQCLGLSFSFSSSALDRIIFEEDNVGIMFLRRPKNTFIKTTNNNKTLTIAA